MTAPLTPNWSCSPTLKPPVQPGCRMRRSSSIAISSLRRTRVIPPLSPRRSLRRCAANGAMDNAADTAQVIIRPPLAWGLAVIAGLALDWLAPLPFLPAGLAAGWVGAMVFVLALALLAWAIVTITTGGSNVPTTLPTTTIVETGPYRFTRNPIYLAMLLSLIGLAIAFDNLWLLMMLVPFALLIRYGVVARSYLERKFGDVYRGYRS